MSAVAILTSCRQGILLHLEKDRQTNLVDAKPQTESKRGAIQGIDALGRNGHKMVTKSGQGEEEILEGKTSIVSDDSS